VVAAGRQRRTRRRAERRRVELSVGQPVVGQLLHRRGLDRPAERLERAEAGVVPGDGQHVRRTLGRLRLLVRRPVGRVESRTSRLMTSLKGLLMICRLRPKSTWSLCTTTPLGSFGIGSSHS
jgi:hypothetical protein